MLLHGRRLRLVFSREWLESRARSPTKRKSSKSRPGSPREFFDGATTAGESHAHPRSHREISGWWKKGVEVEIPAIRFMLEFRTPSERERINIMETPTRQNLAARQGPRRGGTADRDALVVRHGYGVVDNSVVYMNHMRDPNTRSCRQSVFRSFGIYLNIEAMLRIGSPIHPAHSPTLLSYTPIRTYTHTHNIHTYTYTYTTRIINLT
jgi:hypothetical protein